VYVLYCYATNYFIFRPRQALQAHPDFGRKLMQGKHTQLGVYGAGPKGYDGMGGGEEPHGYPYNAVSCCLIGFYGGESCKDIDKEKRAYRLVPL